MVSPYVLDISAIVDSILKNRACDNDTIIKFINAEMYRRLKEAMEGNDKCELAHALREAIREQIKVVFPLEINEAAITVFTTFLLTTLDGTRKGDWSIQLRNELRGFVSRCLVETTEGPLGIDKPSPRHVRNSLVAFIKDCVDDKVREQVRTVLGEQMAPLIDGYLEGRLEILLPKISTGKTDDQPQPRPNPPPITHDLCGKIGCTRTAATHRAIGDMKINLCDRCAKKLDGLTS